MLLDDETPLTFSIPPRLPRRARNEMETDLSGAVANDGGFGITATSWAPPWRR